MNKIELLTLITNNAKEYCKEGNKSVIRNSHMNDTIIQDKEIIEQRHVEAIVVDFINFIGMRQGLDYGLYTKDLKE